MEQRSHDSPSGEIVAALWHLGFAAAYMCALLFHLKGATEHLRDFDKQVEKP